MNPAVGKALELKALFIHGKLKKLQACCESTTTKTVTERETRSLTAILFSRPTFEVLCLQRG